MSETPIAIRAEPSTDPDSFRFTVDREVHPGEPVLFDGRESALGSPLAERLFELPGLATVLISGNVVTVSKAPSAEWPTLLKPIGAAIRAQLQSGKPGVDLKALAASRKSRYSDAELKEKVQELIDQQINPSVAGHGGFIAVEGVKDQILYLKMGGGCQGCASSKVTLRQGVEVLVRRTLPEIREIVDVTDHASGKNPFFQA